jgi:gliding motility-associated lipoprotein GldH
MNSVKKVRRLSLYYIAALLTMAMTMVSCRSQKTLLHEFTAIDGEEWNLGDSLHFEIDSVRNGGRCETTLEFRTNANYPYRNISIVMEQSIRNENKRIRKTLAYDIVDASGRNNGEGITYFTHRVPFCTSDIQTGDTVDIFIRHNMKDDTLPGIADIGVLVENIEY